MSNRQVSDTWEHGNPYEQYVGRWSRQVAPIFLSWLGIPPGRHWVDVGCGTGALSAAIIDHCAPASVTGVEPSAGFLDLAARALPNDAVLRQGSAASLPLADGAADVVVSGLVLNFVPDLPAALAEMIRITAPGGTIAGYVWDYAGGMELIRFFWEVAAELDAEAAKLHEGVRFPICNPDALLEQFDEAGLPRPETTAIDIPTRFSDFEDYWSPFLGGQGPAPAYAMSLSNAARTRLRERLRDRLPSQPDGSIRLNARAWAIRARHPDDA